MIPFKEGRWLMPLLFVVPISAGTISIQPSTLTVTFGQNVSIGVNAAGVADLYGYQFDLGFNPAVLAATSITEGAFLPGAGATFFLPGTIDKLAGGIVATAESLVGTIPGANGGGSLATVNFKALAVGTSAVTLSNVTLLDSNLSTITAVSANGLVSVNVVPEPSTWTLILVSMVPSTLWTILRSRHGTYRQDREHFSGTTVL